MISKFAFILYFLSLVKNGLCSTLSQKCHILLKSKYICHLIVLTSQKTSKQDVYYEKNITQNIDKPVSNIKQNMDKPV